MPIDIFIQRLKINLFNPEALNNLKSQIVTSSWDMFSAATGQHCVAESFLGSRGLTIDVVAGLIGVKLRAN